MYSIPPGIVADRQSTDTVAVDDPHVAAAIHYMRDHVAEPFGMERVIQHAAISRRQLELRFRRYLQTTPHDYLCRLRVERARQLLASPERAKMQKIAAECGLTSVERLRIVFRRVAGQTPSDYRRKASGETQ